MIRVVVVEDEQHLRQELVLTTPWEELGCRVVGEAADGVEGLRVVLRTRPDLVLADIRMPGMDGIAMLHRAQRELPAELAPAIVFLSGHDEFEYAREAVRLGAEDYLLKPVDDEELLRVLKRVVRRRENEARAQNRRADQAFARARAKVTPSRCRSARTSPYVEAAIEYFASHLGEDIGLAETARDLGISESYLSRLFSDQTGYTPNEYLTRLRMRSAVELLRDPRLRIKEVMAQCGYRDASYFGHVFRRLLGVTPSAFRRQHGWTTLDQGRRSR